MSYVGAICLPGLESNDKLQLVDGRVENHVEYLTQNLQDGQSHQAAQAFFHWTPVI